MNSIFTQADHLNLILFHYQDRIVTLIPIRTHGLNEPAFRKSVKCLYTVGKLYTTITPINLMMIHRNLINNEQLEYEPELLAKDIMIPENTAIMFLGLELLEFEDKQQKKNGTYLLKFLMEESVCYYYIPINFKLIGNIWANDSNISLENILASVLKNVLKPIKIA